MRAARSSPPPHAWVKLWKHHAAQPEADEINAVASGAEASRGWRATAARSRPSGSSPKALQILHEASGGVRARRAPDRGCRLGRLAAHGSRDAQHTAPPATRRSGRRRDGFPSRRLLRGARPALRARRRREDVAPHRPHRRRAPAASASAPQRGPGCCPARRSRSRTSTRTSRRRRSAVTQPGTLVVIMGTSICHILLGDASSRSVEGMCGVVEDGVVPGLFGFEAGPVGGRRHLRLVRRALRAAAGTTSWRSDAARTCTTCSKSRRRRSRPGESGLLALDWWNGNRSVLVDADLSGLLVGMTLATRAAEIYRALIEATAFGTRVIVDAFERAGVRRRPDRRLRRPARAEQAADADLRRRARPRDRGRRVAAGARARRGDVRRRRGGRVRLDRRRGSADGGARPPRRTGRTTAAGTVYDALYAEYVRLHDLFGRGGDDVMKTLKRLRDETKDVPRLRRVATPRRSDRRLARLHRRDQVREAAISPRARSESSRHQRDVGVVLPIR